MPTDDEGSVTLWIGGLKAGDHAAAQPLWERYFNRLVSLARAKLLRPGGVEDEEDAALSAFDSLCTGAMRGRFPLLADRDDLWRLLVVITARKAQDQAQRRGRKKRGGGKVVGESALPGAEEDGGLDQIAGREPTPEFAAMIADECNRLLDALGDDSLRRIAVLKMEGCTGEEIAEQLGCSLRTVANKLKLIRMTWEQSP